MADSFEDYHSKSMFDERIDYLERHGARKLGEVTRDFLERCAWLNRRKGWGFEVPKMETRESKLKSDFLERMEKAVLDLEYLQEPFRNGGKEGARFNGKDASAILTQERIVRLVGLTLSLVPDDREYADAILRKLKQFYETKGETVQVVRSIDTWQPGLPGTH